MRPLLLLLICTCTLVVCQFDYLDYGEKPKKEKKEKPSKKDMLRGRNLGRFEKRGRGMPPFLEGATDETKKAVREVVMNKSIDRDEKDRQIEKILKNERPEVQEAFVQFKLEMDSLRADRESEMEERRKRLSEGARQADEQLMQIFKNPDLSPKERREEMKKVFEQLSDSIKQELRSLRKTKKNNKSAFSGVRRQPMRRLKYPQPPTTQLETKPIKTSEDGKFIEF